MLCAAMPPYAQLRVLLCFACALAVATAIAAAVEAAVVAAAAGAAVAAGAAATTHQKNQDQDNHATVASAEHIVASFQLAYTVII